MAEIQWYDACGLCGDVHFPKLPKGEDESAGDGEAENDDDDDDDDDGVPYDPELTEAENAAKEMVRCAKCHVCVHRSCYGVMPGMETKGWTCDWCSSDESGSAPAACALCPTRCASLPVKRWAAPASAPGAPSSSGGGGWAHLVCTVAATQAAEATSDEGVDVRTMRIVLSDERASRGSNSGGAACALCSSAEGVLIPCEGVGGEWVHASCAAQHTTACDLRFLPVRSGTVERSGTLAQTTIAPSVTEDPAARVKIPESGMPPSHSLQLCAFRPLEAAFPMPLYCVCRKLGYTEDDPSMVACGRCQEWFHAPCVGISAREVRRFEEEGEEDYTCARCAALSAAATAAAAAPGGLSAQLIEWNQRKADMDGVTFKLPNVPLLLAMAQVSFLCTVTFHANLAHSLTRSP
jgi:hypothetical protein